MAKNSRDGYLLEPSTQQVCSIANKSLCIAGPDKTVGKTPCKKNDFPPLEDALHESQLCVLSTGPAWSRMESGLTESTQCLEPGSPVFVYPAEKEKATEAAAKSTCWPQWVSPAMNLKYSSQHESYSDGIYKAISQL